MSSVAVKAVERFWELMMTNDFRSVGSALSDEFVLDWPQSKERIRGRDNFAAMNEEYPRHGRWEFTINRIVGSQLLHLSARTRCRWSLRFQVSYLTLLLRRTNRFGPVDFLPRIFAEVAAHRHKVMPRGD